MPWSGRRGGTRRAARFACPHPPPGERGARRRAARDDSQPSRTRCPMSRWPRRSGSRTPTSRQESAPPGEVRRWLGSRVVHCLWPGPSAPSSQCVAGFGLPHFVPPLGAPPFPARPHSQQYGQAPPGRAIPPREAPPAESRVSIASRRQAHPPGGERPSRWNTPGKESTPHGGAPRTSRHRYSPPGDYSPGECVTAELCPSEGRHDPCIQSLHWVQRILHPSHRRYIPWREHVPPMGGTPSSRGTLHTGEVGPTGGRNPRVRYEGGGWVGRGNRRGICHPQEARFPFHSSRPRHPPRRHTMPPQNTQNTPPPPFPTHKTPHLYLHNPCSAHTKPPLQQ